MSTSKCQVCGAEALPGEEFIREGVPFFRRYRCSNCRARLTRKVLQAVFLGNVAVGVCGAVLLVKDPGSEAGRVFLNLFWFALFSYLGILPHELAHAWVGQSVGFRITNVLMGSGPTLFTLRRFAFPVQIKAIPFGGLTFGEPTRLEHLKFRYFAFIAAGPLANFYIAAVVWYLTGQGPTLILTGTATNMLVLANLLLGIESLLPFTFTSPGYGRIQSDGLLLLKLLFGGEPPFAQKPASAQDWEKTVRSGFQKFCALLLLLLGLASTGLAAGLSFTAVGKFWFAVGLIGLFGLLLIWFARRVWIHGADPAAVPEMHDPFTAALTADLNEHALSLPQELRYELVKSVQQQDSEGALRKIDEAERDFGVNIWLEYLKAALLAGQRRFLESYEVYNAILARDVLREESRAVIAIAGLELLLRDHQIDRLRSEVKAIVETRNAVRAKLHVLDGIASLVLYERVTELMSEALQWCEQALRLQPGNLTIRGTRASLLFETGDVVASEAELKEVYALSESPVDKGITSLYLALICKGRGESEEAIRLARRARRYCQLPSVLGRLAAEFPEA